VNLAEATQAVMDRGFDYLSAPRVYLMLNTAKDNFEDVWRWPWLEVVTAGPTPLTLADLKLVLMVKNALTADELLGLTMSQVMQDFTNVAAAGAPQYWWLEGDAVLHAWPGDGADVQVHYVADSPPLVAPADTPRIPARYHHLWVDLAVCEAYKDSDNFQAAQMLRADVYAVMQDVIGRYETRNRQHSPFMTVRAHSEDE
jgi:hypothetical protein